MGDLGHGLASFLVAGLVLLRVQAAARFLGETVREDGARFIRERRTAEAAPAFPTTNEAASRRYGMSNIHHGSNRRRR
jgi:hypothetical protein